MKPVDLNLHVPAGIAALNLPLNEKVALAHLSEHPGSSNGSLAKLLGRSVRGIELMLRRLRESGLLQQVGKGRARVHRLMFPVEHHRKCEEIESAKSHTKSGEN